MSRKWSLAALIAALALTTAPAASGASGDPPASAGWHGREIREPLPRRHATGVVRFPRGWSAGAVHRGTGYANPKGSRRVREVQRRLRHRGYRPGPIDGLFGPRTRAAVIWFQIKHGLSRSGRVDAFTLATLRTRHRTARPPAPTRAPSPRGGSVAPEPTARPAATRDTTDPLGLILAAMLLLGLAAVLALAWAELRGRRARPANVPAIPRAGAWDERPARLTAALLPPAGLRRQADVIGYVAAPQDRDRVLDAGAALIGSSCERRGWHLTRVVHDRESPGAPLADRTGLAYVLDQIAGGRVAGLILAHLRDLSRSPAELAGLLRRLERAGAFLVALDHQLDTTTTAGKLAARVLIDVGGWQRARLAPRPPATGATDGAPRTSRPHDPKLRARIDAMRARGMSLQAICDTLNAEGVPALRPGAHWRPSSVDLAAAPPRKPTRLEPSPLARPTPKEAVNPSA